MPSSITHALIAEESAKTFPPEAAQAAARHPDLFFLGAQGPDPYFFARPMGRAENVGKQLHRAHIYPAFLSLLACVKQAEGASRERALAYAAGYLAHYAADTLFHPPLYRLLSERKLRGMAHQQLENDWDVYFLSRLRGGSVEGYPFPFTVEGAMRDNTLFCIYRALAAVYDAHPTARELRGGLKRFSQYLHHFHRNAFRRQRRWERVEGALRLSPRLGCLYPREVPMPEILGGEAFLRYTEGRAQTADELFFQAVERTTALVERFCAALGGAPLEKALFDMHLLTGEHTA